MSKDSIYYKLKEAATMADFIEAAETGYIALNRDSIYDLDVKLLSMIREVQSMQNKKVASAVNACH